MNSNRTEKIYREYIVDHGLERRGILKLLRSKVEGSPTVLYPGCNVHLCPSFYFQHVVYVDTSEFARDFFAQRDGVLRVVNNRKVYKQKPYIRFENLDFTTKLPFPENSFDLLLSLYTGGVAINCARYLKPGGMILSDNHHGDALDAGKMADLKLIEVVPEPSSPRRKGDRIRRGSEAYYYLFKKQFR